MTFILSTTYPSALDIISLLHLHFILCLPDFRYFSAQVVREAQKAKDRLYY